MTKRAPRTSPGLPPGMFSAVSVPPWASTIWRLIDRPRPEFWPNASPAGPVGVEALEDAVDIVGPDAGTVVVDHDHDDSVPARDRLIADAARPPRERRSGHSRSDW